MICFYHRSSSLGTLSMCQMKYFFVYNLGFKDKQNKAATKGTIVHRVMQCLADKVLAEKNNKKTVDFEGKRLKLAQCDDLELLTKLAFDHYTQFVPELTFVDKDFKDCLNWSNIAINYNDGFLDPRNQNVFATEQFFDFEIKEDWAKFEYNIKGEVQKGYLGIKGTVDLILSEEDNYLQVLDYKTGQRKNWATGKKKEYDDLHYDTQLLLYYYALKNLFPDKEFVLSIYYINDGGLYSFPYDQEHYDRAESILRQKFEYIKNIQVPRQLSVNPEHPTCKYMCAFSKPHEESGKTICQHFYDDIVERGITAVTDQYADINALSKYTGGGRIDQ